MLYWNSPSGFIPQMKLLNLYIRGPRPPPPTATAAVLQTCRLTASRMYSNQCPTRAFGNIVVPPPDILFFYCFITVLLSFPREMRCSLQSDFSFRPTPESLLMSHASFHLWNIECKGFRSRKMYAGFLIGNRSSMIGIASLIGANKLSSASEEVIC